MSAPEPYSPGAVGGAEVRKDGDRWTLVLARKLPQPPAEGWEVRTEPAHLCKWAPFDADRILGSTGPVTLTTAGTSTPEPSATNVTRAEAPKLLEYS